MEKQFQEGRQRAGIQAYDGLAMQISHVQCHAEKRCGRLQYGHALSPKLQEAGVTLMHWQAIITASRNKQDISTTLKNNTH